MAVDRDGLARLLGEDLLEASREAADEVRNAIGTQFTALMTSSPAVVRALIRVMLTSAAIVREFDEEAKESGKAALEAEIAARLALEKTWLDAGGTEPTWPTLPDWVTRARRGIRIGGEGQHQAAAAAFREAATRDPKNARYAYNLGLVLQRAGRADAREWFTRTLALDPSFRPARERLAELSR